MSTLSAASVRHLLRHPAQLVLALAGLALGVAAITAVDVATASASRAFELSLAAVSGPATDEITGGPTGFDEKLYVRLATRFAGLELAPVVEGYGTVENETLQLVGIDPLAEASFAGRFGASPPARSAAPGAAIEGGLSAPGGIGELTRWLTEPGASVLAAGTAKRLGIAMNSHFRVSVAGKSHEAVLIGVERGAQAGGGATLLLTDIAQAQEWLGLVGRLSRIEIRVPKGAAGKADIARLRARLPPDVVLQGVEQSSRTSLAMTHAFTTSLEAMSLLALLVGLFLIYSAMSFAVVQRRKSFAILRALGATRLDLLRLVLVEAAVLGAVGALLGLAAGIALAHTLVTLVSRTVNDLYFVVAVDSLSIPPATVVEALGAGVLTALVAGLLPAWEAGLSAHLGMRRSVLESRAAGAARSLIGVSAALALAAGTILAVSHRSLAAGFIALLLVLLSVAAATPALLEGCARFLARSVSRVSPIGRVALADVAASLSRTGVAVAALALALAAMIGVSMMVESFRLSLGRWLADTLRADVYVSAPGAGIGPERRLDPRVVGALTSVAGVSHYSATRRVTVMSSRGPVTLEAVSPAPETYAGFEVTRSRGPVWVAFRRGAILVAQPLAYRLRLAPGGHLELDTAAGPRSFEIAGIYLDYASDSGVLMDRAVYRRDWGDGAIDSLGLYLAPGAASEKVVAALYSAAAGRQALLIASNSAVRAQSMSIFDRTFVITRVLEWLAAAVAALGLVGSLLAWELERSRELSVLRSLGLEPRGAAGLILAQTAFMGLVALVAAVPAGILAAELLVTVINRRAFGWQIEFYLRGGALLEALGLTLAAALVAGLYPAWRSARASVAADLREE